MLSIARQELANPGMEAKPRTASLVMATGGLTYRRQCCKLKMAVQYSYVHPFLGHLYVVNNCSARCCAIPRCSRETPHRPILPRLGARHTRFQLFLGSWRTDFAELSLGTAPLITVVKNSESLGRVRSVRLGRLGARC